MKLNTKLLPIKLHYFLFMAAMGPILPQLPLLGKYTGISASIMGTINGILPFTFLLMKPIFGLIVDIYREWRKSVFILVIIVTIISFSGLYWIPQHNIIKFNLTISSDTDNNFAVNCSKDVITVDCNSTCLIEPIAFSASLLNHDKYEICLFENWTNLNKCTLECTEDSTGLHRSFTFWLFIILMSVGTIGFNIINSVSDAICFDTISNQAEYGKQRLWGSVGFGFAALISGYLVDIISKNSFNFGSLYITMIIFAILDVIICTKLKLPIIEPPKNIFQDLKILLRNPHVVIFFIFTILAGMLDGLIVYFLFWYLEDLAVETNTKQVKLIEGLILAAETMGAETLFFFISGKILKYLGHANSFSICFINYFIRLVLISIVPSPWWFLPIELIMQGPTFALTYTAIVAYANELAPVGMSATMQGIAVGMGDGTGYALGSILGGLSYKYFGGKITFQFFSSVGLFCGILHYIMHKFVFRRKLNYEEIL